MVGYRYYDTKKTDVLFPFGHGLSYTAFTYNDLEIIRQQENGRQTVKVSCSVTNTGEHAGKETVQIYVAPEQKKDRPVHELKAFEKVRLDAEYLEKRSLWFDLRILWITLLKVLRKDGVSH